MSSRTLITSVGCSTSGRRATRSCAKNSFQRRERTGAVTEQVGEATLEHLVREPGPAQAGPRLPHAADLIAFVVPFGTSDEFTCPASLRRALLLRVDGRFDEH